MSHDQYQYGMFNGAFGPFRARYYWALFGSEALTYRRAWVESLEAVGAMRPSSLIGPAAPFTPEEHAAVDQHVAAILASAEASAPIPAIDQS